MRYILNLILWSAIILESRIRLISKLFNKEFTFANYLSRRFIVSGLSDFSNFYVNFDIRLTSLGCEGMLPNKSLIRNINFFVAERYLLAVENLMVPAVIPEAVNPGVILEAVNPAVILIACFSTILYHKIKFNINLIMCSQAWIFN